MENRTYKNYSALVDTGKYVTSIEKVLLAIPHLLKIQELPYEEIEEHVNIAIDFLRCVPLETLNLTLKEAIQFNLILIDLDNFGNPKEAFHVTSKQLINDLLDSPIVKCHPYAAGALYTQLERILNKL